MRWIQFEDDAGEQHRVRLPRGGRLVVEADGADGVRIHPPGRFALDDAADGPSERATPDGRHEIDAWWPLWLPTLAAVGVELLALVGGFEGLLGPTGAPARAAAYWVVAAGAALGTVRIYDDARRLARAGATWRPNPWAYVLGGGAGVTAVLAVRAGVVDRLPAAAPALAGAFVVGCLAASLLAGPAYLLVRRSRLGRPGGSRREQHEGAGDDQQHQTAE